MVLELRRALKYVTIAFILILSISIAKLAFGYIYGSEALILDGFHSLIDSLTIFSLIIEIRFLRRKPSERFPYGYYKLEDLILLGLSTFFIYISLDFIWSGIESIITFNFKKINIIAAIAAFITGSISYIAGSVQGRASKLTGLASIELNSKEMKGDSLASIFVGLAIISGNYFAFPLDALAAIVLGLFIIRISAGNLWNAILDLMDAWNKPALVEKIKKILLSHEGIRSISMIRLRKAGPLIFGDAIVKVDPEMDIQEIHDIITEAENEIKRNIPSISEIVIHMEPLEESLVNLCVPVDLVNGKYIISEHFARAQYFAIVNVDLKSGKYKVIDYVPNTYIDQKDKVGIAVSKLLSKMNIDCIITHNIGETSFYLLKGRKIRVYQADKVPLEDAIIDFIMKKIRPIDKPSKEME